MNPSDRLAEAAKQTELALDEIREGDHYRELTELKTSFVVHKVEEAQRLTEEDNDVETDHEYTGGNE